MESHEGTRASSIQSRRSTVKIVKVGNAVGENGISSTRSAYEISQVDIGISRMQNIHSVLWILHEIFGCHAIVVVRKAIRGVSIDTENKWTWP